MTYAHLFETTRQSGVCEAVVLGRRCGLSSGAHLLIRETIRNRTEALQAALGWTSASQYFLIREFVENALWDGVMIERGPLLCDTPVPDGADSDRVVSTRKTRSNELL